MILRSNRSDMQPSSHSFTPAERRLIRRLRTPLEVQRFINRLPYNTEPTATHCAASGRWSGAAARIAWKPR